MDLCLSSLLSFLGWALGGLLSFLDDHSWIGDLIATVVAGSLAAWVVFWQVGRQARAAIELQRESNRSAIELQRESNRQSLKVEVYRTLYSILRKAIHSSNKAASDARMLTSSMKIYLKLYHKGKASYKIYHSSDLYDDNNKAVVDTFEAVRDLLEGYLIVNPRRFNVLKHEIISISKEILTRFMEVKPKILGLVPTSSDFDAAASVGFNGQIPTKNNIDNLESAILPYVKVLDVYRSCISDLNVELQYEMLGELFNIKIPARHQTVRTADDERPPADLAELRRPWWRRLIG